MGYTTDFTGHLTIEPPLEAKHVAYLQKFDDTRRMKRDPCKAALLPDPLREAVCLPIGDEGAFFVGGTGMAGQGRDESILDYNAPPGEPERTDSDWRKHYDASKAKAAAGECQPGLWCQWRPSDDGTKLEWDGGEKFYSYIEWLNYHIKHFYGPWGYVLNGSINWQGESNEDTGTIVCENNVVTTENKGIRRHR